MQSNVRSALLCVNSVFSFCNILVFITTIITAVGQDVIYTNWSDEYRAEATKPNFKVIWNMPTFMCQKYGINFTSSSQTWGIIQNSDGVFRGDMISLLYDPGNFPALLDATKTTKSEPRNGGVPQEGDTTQHLNLFRETLSKLMPDTQFNGLGVIDFEHWRPIWRENWGSLNKYREYSLSVENYRNPRMSKQDREKMASKRYEAAAKQFMLQTILAAKKLYPNALWGYYGYPFCFNYVSKYSKFPCTENVIEDNDRSKWLFKESKALFPSMYLRSKEMSVESNKQYIKGRMDEARRMAKVGNSKIPIYAYVWPKYSDGDRFLSYEDMISSLQIPKREGADGVIIWGASNDLNTKEKCLSVQDYLNRILGPMVQNVLKNEEKVNTGGIQSSFLNLFGT